MSRDNIVIDMEETGNRLRNIAGKRGYEVKDIQKFLQLECPQSIYKWYRGESLPSLDNLYKLSKLYETSMENLIVEKAGSRERYAGNPTTINIVVEVDYFHKSPSEHAPDAYLLRLPTQVA